MVNYINKIVKDIYILIPKGDKYIIEFTLFKDKPICFLYKNNIIQKNIILCFNKSLSLGTKIYGTLIGKDFICEKILKYKNKYIKSNFELIYYILNNEINREFDYFTLCMPYITMNRSIFNFSNISYNIYGILHYNHDKMFLIKNLLGHFIIKNDNYIYIENKKYSKCILNDIKSTNLLNKIFNRNIDYKYIEHSDDENENILNECYIICIFIPEKKRWKPYDINYYNKVDTLQYIKYIETTY
jgi:hypothetical protein